MFQGLFVWLKNMTRDAVLTGVAEAVAQLDPNPDADPAPALADLRARLAALPAPDAGDEVPANGAGRKGARR